MYLKSFLFYLLFVQTLVSASNGSPPVNTYIGKAEYRIDPEKNSYRFGTKEPINKFHEPQYVNPRNLPRKKIAVRDGVSYQFRQRNNWKASQPSEVIFDGNQALNIIRRIIGELGNEKIEKCSCLPNHRTGLEAVYNLFKSNKCCISPDFITDDVILSTIDNLWENLPVIVNEIKKSFNLIPKSDNFRPVLISQNGFEKLANSLPMKLEVFREIPEGEISSNENEVELPGKILDIIEEVKDKKKKKQKRSIFKKLFLKIFDLDLDDKDKDKDAKHYLPVYPVMPLQYPSHTNYAPPSPQPQLKHLHYHMYKPQESYQPMTSYSSYSSELHPVYQSPPSSFFDRKDVVTSEPLFSRGLQIIPPPSTLSSPLPKHLPSPKVFQKTVKLPQFPAMAGQPMMYRVGRSSHSNAEGANNINRTKYSVYNEHDSPIQFKSNLNYNLLDMMGTYDTFHKTGNKEDNDGTKVSVEVFLPRGSRDVSKARNISDNSDGRRLQNSVNGFVPSRRYLDQSNVDSLESAFNQLKSLNAQQLEEFIEKITSNHEKNGRYKLKNFHDASDPLHEIDKKYHYATQHPKIYQASNPDSIKYLSSPKYLFPDEYRTILSNLPAFINAVDYTNPNANPHNFHSPYSNPQHRNKPDKKNFNEIRPVYTPVTGSPLSSHFKHLHQVDSYVQLRHQPSDDLHTTERLHPIEEKSTKKSLTDEIK